MPNITINNACLNYNNKVIFKDLAFEWPVGQWISLIGVSGVGKTSLLKLLAGLIPPHNAQTKIQAENFLKSHIAYLPQKDALLPWLTVTENIALKVKLTAHTRCAKKQCYARIDDLLTQVNLSDAKDLYPQQLSGGMRQRVALLRLLLEDKPIVLMDEPFVALDAITRYQLQDLAVSLLKGKSVFFITHDPIEALRLSDRVLMMYDTPAKLKQIANLQSKAPRAFNHPEVMSLQPLIYQQLAQYRLAP